MQIQICNEYLINMDESDVVDGAEEPFLQFLLGNSARIRQLSRFTWCYNNIIQYVANSGEEINTVVEYFGGLGRTATIVQYLVHPDKHILYDYNTGCYNHLTELFRDNPRVKVIYADSLNLPEYLNAEFIIYDCPKFTIQAFYDDNRKHKIDTLAKIFKNKPKFVTVTDTALGYLHFHKENWSKLVNKPIETSNDYISAISSEFSERFGYYITKANHYGKLSAFLLEPTKKSLTILDARDFPESTEYLKVLLK